MSTPQVVRELKRDAFGRVELVDGPAGACVRRIACGGAVPGSRWVALGLLARERRALQHLRGEPGVVHVVDLPGYASARGFDGSVPRPREVLLRSYVEGVPLWAAEELRASFFDDLEALVRALHARGVCHNDLAKEPNILVAAEGKPALVDFQLASVHSRRGRSFRVRAGEDLRHVGKHRARYARHAGAPAADAVAVPRSRSLLARVWMRCGKPLYNLITRRLGLVDGEPRRPAEGPWPRIVTDEDDARS